MIFHVTEFRASARSARGFPSLQANLTKAANRREVIGMELAGLYIVRKIWSPGKGRLKM